MRREKKICIFILIACLSVLFKVMASSATAYYQGKKYVQTAQYALAIDAFSISIRWYAPLNPWIEKSCDELFVLAKDLEIRGNEKLSTKAYAELRYALSSVRGFYFPYFKYADEASQAYVRLKNKKINTYKQRTLSEKKLIELYQLERSQKTLYFFAFAVSFLLWLFFIFKWITKGFTKDGVLIFKDALPSLLMQFICLGVWLWLLKLL